MSRSDVGGVINWSACGIAQTMPVVGLWLLYIVAGMFLIGGLLMLTDKRK